MMQLGEDLGKAHIFLECQNGLVAAFETRCTRSKGKIPWCNGVSSNSDLILARDDLSKCSSYHLGNYILPGGHKSNEVSTFA